MNRCDDCHRTFSDDDAEYDREVIRSEHFGQIADTEQFYLICPHCGSDNCGPEEPEPEIETEDDNDGLKAALRDIASGQSI